jgi:hypothetical protein
MAIPSAAAPYRDLAEATEELCLDLRGNSALMIRLNQSETFRRGKTFIVGIENSFTVNCGTKCPATEPLSVCMHHMQEQLVGDSFCRLFTEMDSRLVSHLRLILNGDRASYHCRSSRIRIFVLWRADKPPIGWLAFIVSARLLVCAHQSRG